MTSLRRLAIAIVALTLLTLGAAGCGVKGSDGATGSDGTATSTTTADSSPRTTEGSSSTDEQDETTTTEGSSSDDEGPDETTPGSDTTVPDFSSIPDSLKDERADAYTGMGLSKEQADCLVDAILDLGDPQDLDPSDMSDLESMMGLFEDCNISLGDFDFGSGGFGQPDSGN